MKHTLLMMVPWLRHRLRCPACDAIGTYKPHGGLLDRQDERKVKRWLCKWCGFYEGPEGRLDATLGPPEEPVWKLVHEMDDWYVTPKAIMAHFADEHGYERAPWPWRG